MRLLFFTHFNKRNGAGANWRTRTTRNRDVFIFYARKILTIAVIGGEFTNLIPYLSFVAESDPRGTHPELSIPAYDLEYLVYLACALIIISDSRSLSRILKSGLFKWTYIATILFVWSMLLRVVSAPAGYSGYLLMRPFGLRINALVFTVGCFVLFDDNAVLRVAKVGVMWATIVAIGLNVFEVFNPGYFSLDPSRSAGLYGDPNGAGVAIVFGTLVGITVISKKWREVLLLAAGLGVVVTFSRQALLAYGILVAGCAVGRVVAVWRMLGFAVLTGCLIAVFVVPFRLNGVISDLGVFNSSNIARLELSLSGASAAERADVAWLMWERFESAPLIGNGFETAGYWTHRQSHNLFLSFMADHGIFGVLLLPALALSVSRRKWESYAFCMILLLWQTFDHELFMYSFGLIVIAMQAIESANDRAIRFDGR